MTKEELKEFLKENSKEEILNKAKINASEISNGEFTIVGGEIYLRENGKIINMGPCLGQNKNTIK